MMNYKLAPTPIITRKKLNKDNMGSNVDPTLFKILIRSITYLTTRRKNIMCALSLILDILTMIL